MRRLTDNVFYIVYDLTRAKVFSLLVAIVYMTLLNTIIIEGIFKLLNVISSSLIHKFFSLPYLAITISMVGIGTVVLSLPLPYRVFKKKKRDIHVLVYTLVSVLLLIYDYALK